MAPPILFRALYSATPPFDSEGNLPPRSPHPSPHIHPDIHLEAHLSWTRTPTPYTSFCTFKKARAMITHLMQKGEEDITLISINTASLGLKSAFHEAQRLGFTYDARDERRRLQNHVGEYLLCGVLAGDSYRLLTVHDVLVNGCFQGIWRAAVEMGGVVDCAEEELLEQVYSHTGVMDFRLRDLVKEALRD